MTPMAMPLIECRQSGVMIAAGAPPAISLDFVAEAGRHVDVVQDDDDTKPLALGQAPSSSKNGAPGASGASRRAVLGKSFHIELMAKPVSTWL